MLEINKFKILGLLIDNQIPSSELFKKYLKEEEITYLILPLIKLLSTIEIKNNNLYSFVEQIYNNYNIALQELGYIEQVPEKVIIIYLTFFISRYSFENIDFLIEKYNEIKEYNPISQYERYIFYQIKINILYIYNLKEEYNSFIMPLIEEINELYETLDKPFIF